MKTRILLFFIPFVIYLIVIGGTNIIIDPMLRFGSINSFNQYFSANFEREQKTNLAYRTAQDYDSVLFGSSRASFINQNDFLNMKVFNYAVNSEKLSEFKPYLDFFTKSSGKQPKNIILVLDFYHTNWLADAEFKNFQKPVYYTKNVNQLDYIFGLLFNVEFLKPSKHFIKHDFKEEPYYNRNNEKFQIKVKDKTRLERYKEGLYRHLKYNYGKNYSWNSKVFEQYNEIKQSYPNSKIIAFTQPFSADLFATYMKKVGHFERYKKWIKGLVEVYGEIYCFMGINTITTNLENYPDDDHYYPHIGKIIAYKLSTMDFESEPKDFGVIVNAKNVDKFLEFQEKQLKEYEFSEHYPHDEIDKIINESKN